MTQKLGQIFKIWSVQNLDIIHSFRISGHLPAHIKNVTNKIGLEIDFENRRISNFNGLVTLPWIGSCGILLFLLGRLFGVDLIVIITTTTTTTQVSMVLS